MALDVPINERGIRIGQYHHRSTISDDVVDQMRDLHEERGVSYGRLATRIKLPYHTVAIICRYERRAQIPHDWRRVDR